MFVPKTIARRPEVSPNEWKEILQDVYSISVPNYRVSIHVPKEPMVLRVPNEVSVDASFFLKEVRPPRDRSHDHSAFMPRGTIQELVPERYQIDQTLLDAHFRDGQFLFGTNRENYGGKPIRSLDDLNLTMGRISGLYANNLAALLIKPGLPDSYKMAIRSITNLVA